MYFCNKGVERHLILFDKIKRYLKFRKGAVTKYKVHSPFVYDYITQVLEVKGVFYCYKSIELVRSKQLIDNRVIEVTDLGAGSKKMHSTKRKISDIAKLSLKSTKYAQILFRTANYFQFQTVLELGTSLGITTSYFAKANKKSKIISFEGCPNIAKIALQNFKTLGINNVELIEGNFDDTFPRKLRELDRIDSVYFDGNHRYEPTMRYFHQALEKKHEQSVFIFDDIYWSDEMLKAWEEIKNHPDVTLTIDLFQIGLVFFKPDIEKQHFKLLF